mmetsp:Transcript_67642/g.161385  ORF Transcript_67642/g.161385 Transcript_67642/m.161385 type:complete len:296 (-) Transcript_67642:511-1398(-)
MPRPAGILPWARRRKRAAATRTLSATPPSIVSSTTGLTGALARPPALGSRADRAGSSTTAAATAASAKGRSMILHLVTNTVPTAVVQSRSTVPSTPGQTGPLAMRSAAAGRRRERERSRRSPRTAARSARGDSKSSTRVRSRSAPSSVTQWIASGATGAIGATASTAQLNGSAIDTSPPTRPAAAKFVSRSLRRKWVTVVMCAATKELASGRSGATSALAPLHAAKASCPAPDTSPSSEVIPPRAPPPPPPPPPSSPPPFSEPLQPTWPPTSRPRRKQRSATPRCSERCQLHLPT